MSPCVDDCPRAGRSRGDLIIQQQWAAEDLVLPPRDLWIVRKRPSSIGCEPTFARILKKAGFHGSGLSGDLKRPSSAAPTRFEPPGTGLSSP